MNDTVLQFLTEVFASSDGNRLPAAYGGHRLFDTPMIGVTAGDDPMIDRFKDVVARAHLTPAEMWSKSAGPGRQRRSGPPIGRPG